jgi:hypothetical protein
VDIEELRASLQSRALADGPPQKPVPLKVGASCWTLACDRAHERVPPLADAVFGGMLQQSCGTTPQQQQRHWYICTASHSISAF